jgi:hypothetical protein
MNRTRSMLRLALVLAAPLGCPGDLVAQECINIAGEWRMDEQATLRCVVTVAGQSDTYSDPLSASRTVNISQTGCSFHYDPGTIGAGRVIQYARTTIQGQIAGATLTATGGTLIAVPGATLLETSFTANGQASQTSMTLTGSGPHHLTQPVPQLPGQIADL